MATIQSFVLEDLMLQTNCFTHPGEVTSLIRTEHEERPSGIVVPHWAYHECLGQVGFPDFIGEMHELYDDLLRIVSDKSPVRWTPKASFDDNFIRVEIAVPSRQHLANAAYN